MSVSEALKRIAFRSERATTALRAFRVLLHHVRRTPHEPDFEFLRDPIYASGLVLDLGANIGQSALSISKVQPRLQVLSIEANPACEPGLRMTQRLLGARFRYLLVGVGAEAGKLPFHVPVLSSRMLLEEGTFDAHSLVSSSHRLGQQGVDYEVKVIDVPMITVDSLGLAPVAVKLDLQGLEAAALLGMRQTLERSRPAVMVEVGDSQDKVTELLESLRYRAHHWLDGHLHVGQRRGSLNTIFLPNRA